MPPPWVMASMGRGGPMPPWAGRGPPPPWAMGGGGGRGHQGWGDRDRSRSGSRSPRSASPHRRRGDRGTSRGGDDDLDGGDDVRSGRGGNEGDTDAMADIEALRAWLAAPVEASGEEHHHIAVVAKQLKGLPVVPSVLGADLAEAVAAARAAAGEADPMQAGAVSPTRAAEAEAAFLLSAAA